MRYTFLYHDECGQGADLIDKTLTQSPYVKHTGINGIDKKLKVETSLSFSEVSALISSIDNDFEILNPYRKVNLELEKDSNRENLVCSLKESEFITGINLDKTSVSFLTSLSEEEVERITRKSSGEMKTVNIAETTYRIKAETDCAECARKVETYLNENKDISKAVFNYPKSLLTVRTTLSLEQVKNLSRKAEDDIEFPDEEFSYVFKVEIDCQECANKVENILSKTPGVRKAEFKYQKGRLKVTTSLSESEIKRICLSAEDDMKFLKEDEKQNSSLLFPILRIAVSFVLFIISEVIHFPYLAVLSYLVAGYDVLWKAVKNIFKGRVFDENFLMAIATIGALVIASYEEAAGVMIFYQVGELFQSLAVGKSRKSISSLLDLTVDECVVEKNGKPEKVKAETVKPGTIIVIKSGERIPLDGVVTDGISFLDTKALTGEPVPVKVEKGSSVLSGSINGEGTLKVRTTSIYEDSTASKIVRLVDESEGKKAKSERFITKFSRYYTPFVCLASLLVAFIAPLIGLSTFSSSLYRACTLLVISCPCALVLSVPLAYFASSGAFAKNGILVKGDSAIHALSKMNALALDKTGTLTKGVFTVQDVELIKTDDRTLRKFVYALEINSAHPIANALVEWAGIQDMKAENIQEIPGIGIKGTVDGKNIMIGSAKSLESTKISEKDEDGTVCYISENGTLIGIIRISDEIKETSFDAIRELRKEGVKEIWMLSGDRKERAERTAHSLGLTGAKGELLPGNKLDELEKMKKKGIILGYAGDGINDAPTIKAADVGISMGGVGSDVAIEASDVVIMNDDIMKIADAKRIARKTGRIVNENIVFSLTVKFAVFILAIFGLTNMWVAVFADTGVALLAVMNSMRSYFYKASN